MNVSVSAQIQGCVRRTCHPHDGMTAPTWGCGSTARALCRLPVHQAGVGTRSVSGLAAPGEAGLNSRAFQARLYPQPLSDLPAGRGDPGDRGRQVGRRRESRTQHRSGRIDAAWTGSPGLSARTQSARGPYGRWRPAPRGACWGTALPARRRGGAWDGGGARARKRSGPAPASSSRPRGRLLPIKFDGEPARVT